MSETSDLARQRRLRWFTLAASAALLPLTGGRRRALSPHERQLAEAVVILVFAATGDGRAPVETTIAEVGAAAGLGDGRHIIAALDVLHRCGVVTVEPVALLGGRIRLTLRQPKAHPLGDDRGQLRGPRLRHVPPEAHRPAPSHASQPARTRRSTPTRTARQRR